MVFIFIHVEEKGDTLWNIAQKYNTSVQRIITDNGLFDLKYLVVGQALLILIPEIVHTVKHGDSLYSISKQYGVPIIKLLQRNPNLIKNTELRPGQNITIKFKDQQNRNAVFNGYAYQYINKNLAKYCMPYLSEFTIFGYGFKENGELIPVEDDELIKLAYQFDTAPIILLSSITEDGTFSGELASMLFNNKEVQNLVIMNLINVMNEKGYLGIDIDFEYIDPSDGDAFLRFLENITEQMHSQGYTVNVDLAPKISASQVGLLYEAHNYREIGKIVDSVLLMTYEWGYTYGFIDICNLQTLYLRQSWIYFDYEIIIIHITSSVALCFNILKFN